VLNQVKKIKIKLNYISTCFGSS